MFTTVSCQVFISFSHNCTVLFYFSVSSFVTVMAVLVTTLVLLLLINLGLDLDHLLIDNRNVGRNQTKYQYSMAYTNMCIKIRCRGNYCQCHAKRFARVLLNRICKMP